MYKTPASKWTNISFRGNNVAFWFYCSGNTVRTALDADNQNTVGWSGITRTGNTLAICRPWVSQNDATELVETDIAFNYYKRDLLKPHGQVTDDTVCIRDIATHEFGHAAGLNDVVRYNPNEDKSPENCPEYNHYSMNTSSFANNHYRESLACEDKYCMDYKY